MHRSGSATYGLNTGIVTLVKRNAMHLTNENVWDRVKMVVTTGWSTVVKRAFTMKMF